MHSKQKQNQLAQQVADNKRKEEALRKKKEEEFAEEQGCSTKTELKKQYEDDASQGEEEGSKGIR